MNPDDDHNKMLLSWQTCEQGGKTKENSGAASTTERKSTTEAEEAAPGTEIHSSADQRVIESNTPTECKSWTIVAFSIITFGLAVASIAHCSFLTWQVTSTRRKLGGVWMDAYYGLFGYRDSGSSDDVKNCKPFWSHDYTYDASTQVARVFGVIAVVLTGLAMVYVLMLVCGYGSQTGKKIIWRCVQIIYPCAVLSQSLTFLLFNDSDFCDSSAHYGTGYCMIGPVGIVAAVNVILLLIVSIFTLYNRPPKPKCTWCSSHCSYSRQVWPVVAGLIVLFVSIIVVVSMIFALEYKETAPEEPMDDAAFEAAYGDPAEAAKCNVAPYQSNPYIGTDPSHWCSELVPGHTNWYWENEKFLCRLNQRPCDTSWDDWGFYMDLGNEGIIDLQDIEADDSPFGPAEVWLVHTDMFGNVKHSWEWEDPLTSCVRLYSQGNEYTGDVYDDKADYVFASLVCCEPQDDNSRFFIIIDGVLVDSCPKRISRDCRQC